MTADEINIPKIDLALDSVLIPKINPTSQPEAASGLSSPSNETDTNPPSNMRNENPKGRNVLLIFSGCFVGFIILVIVVLGIPSYFVYQKGMVLYKSVKDLEVVAKSQDLSKIKTQIGVTTKDLSDFKSSYQMISWVGFVPYVGGYVSDLGHTINAAQAGLSAGVIVIDSIEPYSDLLGLKGSGQKVAIDGAKNAQDRINFIVQSLPGLLPQMDKISEKMNTIEKEISQINAERYPLSYKGIIVRANIKTVQDLVNQASTLLVNGKPVIENATYLLGMNSPRTYLLLFQNDKELRPTGGFMTAYAIMTVDKAKFNPVLSDDIYNLDAKYKPSIPAPDPIVKYIKGPYVLNKNLRLRDMNWSPDFPTSMKMFTEAIAGVGVKNIDGIIAVDTKVLDNLLNVIGPIGVPGFGNFSTAIDPQCNCSQVIHALEAYADVEGPIIWDPLTGKIIQRPANSENRKKIIGPLMNSILANAMGQPKDKLAPLFTAAFNSVMEKDVLIYLLDTKMQQAIADFGIGGAIRQDYKYDYLSVIDANLGGRKSNLYATEDVTQDVKIAGDGSVTKTVTITYKNPEKQDGWLNSVLPTWVRVYVPKGSTLVSSDGLDAKSDPYEELGKTVFAGYFQLRPEGVAKVTFEYKLPFKATGQYKLLIQKQPGTKDYLYTINAGSNQQEFYLKTDKEVIMGL
jgi:hypothetical protein